MIGVSLWTRRRVGAIAEPLVGVYIGAKLTARSSDDRWLRDSRIRPTRTYSMR